MPHNLKVGDKGTIAVRVTRIDALWVTFTVAGYAHPVISVTETVTPTKRRSGDGECLLR